MSPIPAERMVVETFARPAPLELPVMLNGIELYCTVELASNGSSTGMTVVCICSSADGADTES